MNETALSGYARLEGAVPVVHAPELWEQAEELRRLLESGSETLSEVLEVDPPDLEAFLIPDNDWDSAPRGNAHPYPPGLPYFTRSAHLPALVLPEKLSLAFQPRTETTYPLAVWHELAHAFLLSRDVIRTPAWLGEFVPQAGAAAVARRSEQLPFAEHLAQVNHEPGFTIRSLKGQASAERQMEFQNLLLLLGAAALEEFGEGFLKRLVRALWEEVEPVGEKRAEELLAEALGPGGREWLRSRREF